MASRTLSVRVPDDLRAQIKAVAEATDRPEAYVVTTALREYLARESQFLEHVHAAKAYAASPEAVWVRQEDLEERYGVTGDTDPMD